MKVGIIGGGVVGRATARTYLEHVEEVRVYDEVKERRTHSLSYVLNCCDLIFVCVPETSLDSLFSQILSSPGGMEKFWKNCNYVLKSTVPIGATRRLAEKYGLANLVHSPEFLTERCAVTDSQVPARNIIGVPNGSGSENLMPTGCARVLHCLYVGRFPGVHVLCMLSDESEAVKLMTNAFFAVKVSFFNEMREFCDKVGLNWDSVLGGVLSGGRITHSHTQVPGPDGKRGWGGRCLPKDLQTLLTDLWSVDVNPTMLKAAQMRNERDDRREGTDANG